MPNYDDLFTGQPAQREEKPFDKTVWAAKKQAEREGVYAMIDNYVQDMGKEGGLFQAYQDVQAWVCPTMRKRSLIYLRPRPTNALLPLPSGMSVCC